MLRRRPETFAPCMGTMPSERAWQENSFFGFKEIRFDIGDTTRSGRPSGFDEHCLNTLIHNVPRQCTRELANVLTVTIPASWTFAFNGQDSKIGCMVTACSKPKPHKSAGASLLARHRVVREQH